MGKHSSRHITQTPVEKPPPQAVTPNLDSAPAPASEPSPEAPAPDGPFSLAFIIVVGGFLFLFLMIVFELLFGLLRG